MKKMKKIGVVLLLAALVCLPVFAGCKGKPGRVKLQYIVNDEKTEYSVRHRFGIYANGVVELPSEHKKNLFDKKKPVTKIESSGFRGATNFVAVTIPESITEIGNHAFNRCYSLTVIMKSSVPPKIYGQSFGDGTPGERMVKYIIVPKDAVETYKEAWKSIESTNSKGEIEYNKNLPGIIYSMDQVVDKFLIVDSGEGGKHLLSYFGGAASVTIPGDITKTGVEAFIHNDLIHEVTIPKNVEIGGLTSESFGAFDGCRFISKITLEDGNPNYSIADGIIYNKDKTAILLVPQALKADVTIPDTVVKITSRIFLERKKLTSVTIPATVKTIETDSFHDCSSKMTIKALCSESAKPTGWVEGWNSGLTVEWAG